MSGKIELKVRKSKPGTDKYGRQLRPDIKYYPGWTLKVYQEKDYGSFDENNFVELMPSFAAIKEMFKAILIHELQVDLVMGRRNDFAKWKKYIEEGLPNLTKNLDLDKIKKDIPEKIKDCKK